MAGVHHVLMESIAEAIRNRTYPKSNSEPQSQPQSQSRPVHILQLMLVHLWDTRNPSLCATSLSILTDIAINSSINGTNTDTNASGDTNATNGNKDVLLKGLWSFLTNPTNIEILISARCKRSGATTSSANTNLVVLYAAIG